MSNLDAFYDINPVGVIDRNKWSLQDPEVNLKFRALSVYTPLISWDASFQQVGASEIVESELIAGDVNFNEIPLTANYIDSQGLDSRYRKFTVARFGGKVQMHKSSNIFQQWQFGGGRDWRPVLRSTLGDYVVRLNEALARNVWFKGDKTFWTYAGSASNWDTLTTSDVFSISKINEWNLRLGYTGAPLIPGDTARAKLAIIPPGATYAMMQALPGASGNETALWRDAMLYAGAGLFNYEVGTYKNVRFIEAPSDEFGINPNVLYNAGRVTKQYGVTQPIRIGDGAPDPDTTAVDSVWHIGQKNVTHYIQLEDFSSGDFAVNDYVTIHVKTTTAYGVTGGVDPFDGQTIVRRIVAKDASANTLSFDRPIMFNYTAAFNGKSVTGNTDGAFYAYVTKAVHIGFALVLGSRGGVAGKVMKPIEFYNPKPVDDFDSVWRFSFDEILGYNVAEPHAFELYFFAVNLPKPGGVA